MRKTVGEIIDTIKSLKGFTKDYEVADTLGVGRAALSNAKQRDRVSFLDELVGFCDKEGYTLDFIRCAPWASLSPRASVKVPGFSIMGGAPGDLSPLETDSVLLPKEVWNDSCVVIRVNGDSMEKLIMDGAKAVVDTGSKDIVSGHIYAFNIPHEGSIVRECFTEPGGLTLAPCNRNYPPSSIKWADLDPEMILGKVTCTLVNVFR